MNVRGQTKIKKQHSRSFPTLKALFPYHVNSSLNCSGALPTPVDPADCGDEAKA
jgi:hypothetical protein